jgi:hypothetical protein
MSYADVKAALLAHATTAGAAVTPAIKDVKFAFPVPKDRCIRLFYGGEADPPRFASRNTLASEMVGTVVRINAFFAVTALDEAQAEVLENQARAYSAALRTAIDGDTNLGGDADNVLLGDAEVEPTVVGNARYLVVSHVAVVAYEEYALART